MNKVFFQNAELFKALADKNRLMILDMLTHGELCACKILERFQLSQPTLSHHMKILVDSGVVAARKDGKWTYYSISAEGSEYAIKLLRELTTVTVSEKTVTLERCCNE